MCCLCTETVLELGLYVTIRLSSRHPDYFGVFHMILMITFFSHTQGTNPEYDLKWFSWRVLDVYLAVISARLQSVCLISQQDRSSIPDIIACKVDKVNRGWIPHSDKRLSYHQPCTVAHRKYHNKSISLLSHQLTGPGQKKNIKKLCPHTQFIRTKPVGLKNRYFCLFWLTGTEWQWEMFPVTSVKMSYAVQIFIYTPDYLDS